MSPESTAPTGQALPAGTRLEEFEVERVLGTGGFGITYLARDVKLGRQVVIKENLPVQFAFRDMSSLTVSPRNTEGEDAGNFAWSLENFSREASMLASLDHPGIVPVMRSFEAFGTSYFVMPYMEGLPLDELMKNRRERGEEISDDELRGLLEHVLDALGYLHARGIYHRDIKPGNILVTKEGVPILIDFGSARQRLSERSMTVVESAGYTPFEQLQSRGNVGPWSDLYALGATVAKAITGEAPPKANDRAFDDPWVPLSKRTDLRERYSGVLLGSIDRALEPQASPRFQDSGEWLRALQGEQLASGEEASVSSVPAAKPEPSSVEVSGGPARAPVLLGSVSPEPKGKGKGMLVAAAAAAVLLIVGAVVVQTGNTRAEEERVRLAEEEKEAERKMAATELVAQKKAEEMEAARKKAEAALATLKKATAAEAARMKAEEELAAQKTGPEELRLLAKKGDAYAQALLGDHYIYGSREGLADSQIAEREREGAALIKQSADQAHPLGLFLQGLLFENEGDSARAEIYFNRAVKEGLVEHASSGSVCWWQAVGISYASGHGVRQDLAEAFRWTEKAALEGYSDSQVSLGVMYAEGVGVAKDEKEAAKWYRKAAEQGKATAQIYLGVMYQNGRGVAKDKVEAVEWYRKAAEQGNAMAQLNLGWMYEDGLGVAKDEAEAVEWYRKAAEQDDADAQNHLGWMYANGRGVLKDEAEAVKWYRKAAEQDNADAQTELGVAYANGHGVAKDEAEAVEWYRKAAEQGDARGQTYLGRMYADGRGVAKDFAEAVEWYRKAAAQDYANAQAHLGRMYADGHGVAKDKVEAVKWYRKAAEQDDAGAQRNLGRMYEDGRGVTKDEKKAVEWYRKAAEQGDAVGQNNLGWMYADGRGVAKDEKEAVKWFRKAAEQDYAWAQYSLGVMYEVVAKDEAEALKWYRKAAAQGDADAKAALRELGVRE